MKTRIPVTSNYPQLLTPEQEEVAELIARGQCTKEIASALGISGKTVAYHWDGIKKRLRINSYVALARWAIQTRRVAV
jgi:DNA-binding CsgD family transcriptional regulator